MLEEIPNIEDEAKCQADCQASQECSGHNNFVISKILQRIWTSSEYQNIISLATKSHNNVCQEEHNNKMEEHIKSHNDKK